MAVGRRKAAVAMANVLCEFERSWVRMPKTCLEVRQTLSRPIVEDL
jgi:hypothetical protein